MHFARIDSSYRLDFPMETERFGLELEGVMFPNAQIKWLPSLATQLSLLILVGLLALGCGGSPEGRVLRADAEFDFDIAASVLRPLNEANLLVAQTFTIEEESGLFEEFWIVLIDGASDDDGTVRVTVRPLDAMDVPDSDESSSIITPIDVDTSTLPTFGEAEFAEFDVGDDIESRDVAMGEEYAIVVEFISRATSTDVDPIANLLGVSGNPFADGTGSEDDDDTGFVNSTDDYFFRTFVLGDL
ncbi:MAG: hypothetical protein AB8G23_17430 [Myxococcota bacterium]